MGALWLLHLRWVQKASPAVIRYCYRIGADREAARDVLRAANAFDQQASRPEIAKASKIVPVEACAHLAPQKSILCL